MSRVLGGCGNCALAQPQPGGTGRCRTRSFPVEYSVVEEHREARTIAFAAIGSRPHARAFEHAPGRGASRPRTCLCPMLSRVFPASCLLFSGRPSSTLQTVAAELPAPAKSTGCRALHVSCCLARACFPGLGGVDMSRQSVWACLWRCFTVALAADRSPWPHPAHHFDAHDTH